MLLSTDERALLTKIAQATRPVPASDFFPELNPPPPGLREMSDDHPEREVWAERQISLYGVYLSLHDKGAIHIAVPADGENPDKAEPTEAGRAALA